MGIAMSEILDVLIEARRTIQAWYGAADWDTYNRLSPEMYRLNQMIERVKSLIPSNKLEEDV